MSGQSNATSQFWVRCCVPDVLHELSPQVGNRREYTARNDVAFDLGKPEFDLVEPGGVGRSEMQVNLGMSSQKVVDLSRLMGGEVVGNPRRISLPRGWLTTMSARKATNSAEV